LCDNNDTIVPQAKETREEYVLYLSHHINCKTTHLLLEVPCDDNTGPYGDDTAGPSDADSDRNDFSESLSHAQLTRVRNQAIFVRAYLKMIDRHHPEWSVNQCAAEVAEMMGVASGTTVQSWFREYANSGNKFKPDSRGLDVPDWILDMFTTTEFDEDTGEAVTFELIFRRWCRANLKTLSVRAATDFLNDELLKDTPVATFKKFHVTYPIVPSVAWTWMHRVGCGTCRRKKIISTQTATKPRMLSPIATTMWSVTSSAKHGSLSGSSSRKRRPARFALT
jgi:hypothetical protein